MSCRLLDLPMLLVATLIGIAPAMATAAAPVAAPVTATVQTPGPAAADEDDDALPFKLSLPTIADRDAWRTAGFRLHLGYAYGQLFGVAGTPDAITHIILARAGVRLDADWSIMFSLAYAVASEGLIGLRFAGTIDPTWHLGDHFYLAMGGGVAGVVESESYRDEPNGSQRDALVATYTFPDATPLLPTCSGMGVTALLRAGASMVIGPLASTELALQVDGQWVGCEESLGRVEPDTAKAIMRRQWWPHLGANLAWTVVWR